MMNDKERLLSVFDDLVTEEQKKKSKLLSKISNTIIKERLKMKMSQKDFAKFLNVSQPMISKIESEYYNFTIENMVNIFSKLNIDLDIIFNDLNNVSKSTYSLLSHHILSTVNDNEEKYNKKNCLVVDNVSMANDNNNLIIDFTSKDHHDVSIVMEKHNAEILYKELKKAFEK